jgi:hypothetical protein
MPVGLRVIMRHPKIDVTIVCNKGRIALIAMCWTNVDIESKLLCMRKLLNHSDINVDHMANDSTTTVSNALINDIFLAHALLTHVRV